MSIYRFGPFEVRTRVRELYRSGTKVRLRGQPFQILQALLNRPGEVVTREEMRDHLWPSDTFVDFEHGINASLRKLRQALGDSALKPLYIETLPGVGYRFIAPFETAVEEPALKGGDTGDRDPPDDSVTEEVDEKERLAFGSGAVGRGRFLLGVVVGILGVGLLLFAANWGRRVVHGATADPHDNPGASTSPALESEALPHERGTVLSGGSSSSSHPDGPIRPGFSPIRGKVWVVSVAQASKVTFPPPTAIPDATFETRGIAYMGSEPKNCYSLESFLTDCASRGFDLKFSGVANPNLGGAAAGPATAMSGSTWGVLIEFNGTADLVKGQGISILHDDGVALEIDGQPIAGFDALPAAPLLESARFNGQSGVHTFDLLYANATGAGAWLLFYAALY